MFFADSSVGSNSDFQNKNSTLLELREELFRLSYIHHLFTAVNIFPNIQVFPTVTVRFHKIPRIIFCVLDNLFHLPITSFIQLCLSLKCSYIGSGNSQQPSLGFIIHMKMTSQFLEMHYSLLQDKDVNENYNLTSVITNSFKTRNKYFSFSFDKVHLFLIRKIKCQI